MSKIVERMARAICERESGPLAHYPSGEPMRRATWDDFTALEHEAWRGLARASLRSVRPEDISDAMVEAAKSELGNIRKVDGPFSNVTDKEIRRAIAAAIAAGA